MSFCGRQLCPVLAGICVFAGPFHVQTAQDKPLNRTGYAHIAFSVGSKERVDELTKEMRAAGYEVVSGPRTTGDGYYESCVIAIEGNQIEITE